MPGRCLDMGNCLLVIISIQNRIIFFPDQNYLDSLNKIDRLFPQLVNVQIFRVATLCFILYKKSARTDCNPNGRKDLLAKVDLVT